MASTVVESPVEVTTSNSTRTRYRPTSPFAFSMDFLVTLVPLVAVTPTLRLTEPATPPTPPTVLVAYAPPPKIPLTSAPDFDVAAALPPWPEDSTDRSSPPGTTPTSSTSVALAESWTASRWLPWGLSRSFDVTVPPCRAVP